MHTTNRNRLNESVPALQIRYCLCFTSGAFPYILAVCASQLSGHPIYCLKEAGRRREKPETQPRSNPDQVDMMRKKITNFHHSHSQSINPILLTNSNQSTKGTTTSRQLPETGHTAALGEIRVSLTLTFVHVASTVIAIAIIFIINNRDDVSGLLSTTEYIKLHTDEPQHIQLRDGPWWYRQ